MRSWPDRTWKRRMQKTSPSFPSRFPSFPARFHHYRGEPRFRFPLVSLRFRFHAYIWETGNEVSVTKALDQLNGHSCTEIDATKGSLFQRAFN